MVVDLYLLRKVFLHLLHPGPIELEQVHHQHKTYLLIHSQINSISKLFVDQQQIKFKEETSVQTQQVVVLWKESIILDREEVLFQMVQLSTQFHLKVGLLPLWVLVICQEVILMNKVQVAYQIHLCDLKANLKTTNKKLELVLELLIIIYKEEELSIIR